MSDDEQLARINDLIGRIDPKKDPNDEPWAVLGDELARLTSKAKHLRPSWWRVWREKRNLNTLRDVALFAQFPIREALRSTLVRFAADAFFALAGDKPQELFRTNPANTTLYRGLKAIEDKAVIDLAELLKKPP